MAEIWLLEFRGRDPKAFRNYEDAVPEFIEDTRLVPKGAGLEELAAALDEEGLWYEFAHGRSLAIDDGPHLHTIEIV